MRLVFRAVDISVIKLVFPTKITLFTELYFFNTRVCICFSLEFYTFVNQCFVHLDIVQAY
jgi:hypothetical protein